MNWFRKNADGEFIWPGFGENSRVLKWIVQRLNGEVEGVRTPIGLVPAPEELDTEGLDIDPEDLRTLLTVDPEVWREEAKLIPPFFETFGDHLPGELWDEYHALLDRLG